MYYKRTHNLGMSEKTRLMVSVDISPEYIGLLLLTTASVACWNEIPARVDVDWQLNAASHRLLKHGTVRVIVAFSEQNQLTLIGAYRHLATVDHIMHIRGRF